MDILYKIVGVRTIGERVCLTCEMVKEGEKLNTTKILGNLKGFMDDMKLDAVNSRNPDQISITKQEYDKGFYSLGDMISVTINGG